MFDPRSFATDGLYPGLFSTLSFAVIGAFDVEVTIVPVTPTGGGGGYSAPIKPKYKIRIKSQEKIEYGTSNLRLTIELHELLPRY